jgi:hypothetical protein
MYTPGESVQVNTGNDRERWVSGTYRAALTEATALPAGDRPHLVYVNGETLRFPDSRVRRPATFPLAMTGGFRDTREDGCNLLGTVELLGQLHHIGAIRVRETGGIQGPMADEDEGIFEDIGRLYDAAFATVEIPGFAGRFVVYMHPYED